VLDASSTHSTTAQTLRGAAAWNQPKRPNPCRIGVEPICMVLQVAQSTYCAARNRPLSERAQRDAQLVPRLAELWKEVVP